jgi:hypothetical protein
VWGAGMDDWAGIRASRRAPSNAIGGRGSRKDLVDPLFYLKNRGRLDEVLSLARMAWAQDDQTGGFH